MQNHMISFSPLLMVVMTGKSIVNWSAQTVLIYLLCLCLFLLDLKFP